MQVSGVCQCSAPQQTRLPERLRSKCTVQIPPQQFPASKLKAFRTGSNLWMTTARASRRRHDLSVQAKKSSVTQTPEQQSVASTESSSGDKQALYGQLSLLGTALLWGTNAPANRFLYLQGPGQAPIPSLIPAVQTTAAAIFLVLIDVIGRQLANKPKSDGDSSTFKANGANGASASAGSDAKAWPFNILALTETDVRAAAFEIGFWAAAAQCLTVTGFANTTTSRGAFLVRLSAVFTPIVAATFADKVAVPVWIGSLAALAGGVFIGLDGSGSDAASGLNLTSGDILIIIAAIVWSIQTVRVGKLAPNFKPITLAKLQLATMSLLSTAWFAKDAIAAASQGSSLDSLWGGFNQPLNWGVLLIPAIGPWSAGVALQLKGQSTVPASVAMLIFATDPVWAILYAGLLGGSEQHLGSYGLIGAGCILSASVIASFGSRKS